VAVVISRSRIDGSLSFPERENQVWPFLKQLRYCDHIEGTGEELFQLIGQRGLEGVVAKRKFDPYLLNGTASWLKIRNRKCSQWEGREELFERDRHQEPVAGWHSCAIASARLETNI
jgi:hypothetical protein